MTLELNNCISRTQLELLTAAIMWEPNVPEISRLTHRSEIRIPGRDLIRVMIIRKDMPEKCSVPYREGMTPVQIYGYLRQFTSPRIANYLLEHGYPIQLLEVARKIREPYNKVIEYLCYGTTLTRAIQKDQVGCIRLIVVEPNQTAYAGGPAQFEQVGGVNPIRKPTEGTSGGESKSSGVLEQALALSNPLGELTIQVQEPISQGGIKPADSLLKTSVGNWSRSLLVENTRNQIPNEPDQELMQDARDLFGSPHTQNLVQNVLTDRTLSKIYSNL